MFQNRERELLVLECSQIDIVPCCSFTLLFEKRFKGLKQKLHIFVIGDLFIDYDSDDAIWKASFEVENCRLTDGGPHNCDANSSSRPQPTLGKTDLAVGLRVIR